MCCSLCPSVSKRGSDGSDTSPLCCPPCHRELVPTLDISLPVSLMSILEALMSQLPAAAGQQPPAQPPSPELLHGLFAFALVWSIGGTTDSAGRSAFDGFLRKLLARQVEAAAERSDYDLGPGLAISYPAEGLELRAPPQVSCWRASCAGGVCCAC